MHCPNCQTEVPAGKFCVQCGAGLGRTCPACGTSYPDGARFCPGCGHKLDPAPALRATVTAEPERRQLTILFADLAGSTALSARLDPEDMGRVLRAYQACCASVVQRWGGYLAKYLGDGVLAYFGYPQAHEDSAERAVRAGLELTEAVGRLEVGHGARLAARVGIATGLVVVGELIGEGAAKEEAVVGDTPNLAARLQAQAEPSAVVIAPGTRRILGDLFDLTDLGPHQLKGFAGPIQAWRVAGVRPARSRFDALRRTHRMRLIGRGRELKVLGNALEQVVTSRGQVVAAVGEPGVGKSRLFDTFLHSADLDGWRVLSCGCHSYGSGIPWLPVIDLVKDYMGIQDYDDREHMMAKVDECLVPFGEFRHSARAALFALLGLTVADPEWHALNPALRRRRILDVAKGLLLLASERQPLVVLVEDLHWADGETLALLDSLIEGVPTRPVLLLVNYRPEFQHAWGGRTYYSQLRIDPLGADRAAELLADLLGGDPGLAALKRELITRTAGNPLFLEEAVRDLAETGALAGAPGAYRLSRELRAVRVPETVQAILAARIDRLARGARHVLQRAAVIGHDTPLPVLEAVVDLPGEELHRRLGELQAAEMLYETRLFPEPEYTFKHALTREVAYDGLLHEARRALHRRVGEAIEALYSSRLGELTETLAKHFERGEVWAKAALYALDAAEKAKACYAYPVGMRFAERAREAAAKDENLTQEWIWASVLHGDLASLVDGLELANRSYDEALGRSQDPSEQRWITNKRHELGRATRDGAEIAFYEHGSGEETILFASPIGYGLAMWQPLVERLCQEFRIITIDMRGTGRSAPIIGPYTDRDHALDIAAVVRAASDRPIVGVAVSAAPYALVRAAADPKLFKKLVLVGGEPGADLSPGGGILPRSPGDRGGPCPGRCRACGSPLRALHHFGAGNRGTRRATCPDVPGPTQRNPPKLLHHSLSHGRGVQAPARGASGSNPGHARHGRQMHAVRARSSSRRDHPWGSALRLRRPLPSPDDHRAPGVLRCPARVRADRKGIAARLRASADPTRWIGPDLVPGSGRPVGRSVLLCAFSVMTVSRHNRPLTKCPTARRDPVSCGRDPSSLQDEVLCLTTNDFVNGLIRDGKPWRPRHACEPGCVKAVPRKRSFLRQKQF